MAYDVVDGDTESFFLSRTAMVTGEWIQLQLENVALVTKVVITESSFGRVDKASKKDEHRLRNIYIRVGDIETSKDDHSSIEKNELCGTFPGPGVKEEKIIVTCKPSASKGKFITVHKMDQSILNIAEIEVIGKEITSNGTVTGQ